MWSDLNLCSWTMVIHTWLQNNLLFPWRREHTADTSKSLFLEFLQSRPLFLAFLLPGLQSFPWLLLFSCQMEVHSVSAFATSVPHARFSLQLWVWPLSPSAYHRCCYKVNRDPLFLLSKAFPHVTWTATSPQVSPFSFPPSSLLYLLSRPLSWAFLLMWMSSANDTGLSSLVLRCPLSSSFLPSVTL